jgi:hypothetical protein
MSEALAISKETDCWRSRIRETERRLFAAGALKATYGDIRSSQMNVCRLRLPGEDLKIEIKYEIARIATALTGIKHVVDHIVPLSGHARIDGKHKRVASGLHVSWNLRVVTAAMNAKKAYLLPPPDMSTDATRHKQTEG